MILTTIDGMPLYSTTTEAVAHAIRIGLQGYHSHVFRGRNGYMAGVSHNSITNNRSNTQTTITPTTTPVTQPTISRTSSNTSTGGGGGY
jgi:hypothetical protein